jgi:hypothetical protein
MEALNKLIAKYQFLIDKYENDVSSPYSLGIISAYKETLADLNAEKELLKKQKPVYHESPSDYDESGRHLY